MEWTNACTGENWIWNLLNFCVGLAIIIWASIKMGDDDDSNAEHQYTWPNVPDNYRTPPIKGYGTGRVYTDFYNIYFVIIFAGVAHTLMASAMLFSSTWKCFGRNSTAYGTRRIYNMMETAGYHGITDSLILVVLLKALGVLEPYAVYSLMACHFAAFYIIGLSQTENTDLEITPDASGATKSIFLNLPAIAVLVPVWIVLFVYYCYFLDTDEGASVGEYAVSGVVKHNAVLFFVMDVLGIFTIRSSAFDQVLIMRFTLSRFASTVLRVYILFTLLAVDHRHFAYNVLEQSSFP